jgi:hypothetical protein
MDLSMILDIISITSRELTNRGHRMLGGYDNLVTGVWESRLIQFPERGMRGCLCGLCCALGDQTAAMGLGAPTAG